VADRLRPKLTKLAVSWVKRETKGGDCVLGEGGLTLPTRLAGWDRGTLWCADIFFVRAGLDYGFLYGNLRLIFKP
jgi:hypothetical protein